MQNQHVIGQLTVEVQGASIATAADYQRACSQQIRSEHFLSALNDALNRVDQADVVWQIPRLEIELQIDREEQFGSAFLDAFRHKIAQQASYSSRQKVSEENSITAFALHFLETGTLPWNATPLQKSAVQNLLAADNFSESPTFLQSLEQKASLRPNIWLRFIYTVGIERVKQLLRAHYGFSHNLVLWLETIAASQPNTDFEGASTSIDMHGTSTSAFHPWQWALHYHELAAQGESYFKAKILEISASEPQNSDRPHTNPERTALQEWMPPLAGEMPFEEAIFIQNAGLVLLAQFFPVLFQRAGLVENRQFVNETAQQTAVQLLQYLVTGEDHAWEHALLLNKILCDLPGEAPLNRFAPFSEQQRQEADGLLTEAIRQWSVLKHTSVQGLREMFLERDGKLTRNGKNWRLQVERKAFDVLLERLPLGWGYSVIKLPWMEGVLYVEW